MKMMTKLMPWLLLIGLAGCAHYQVNDPKPVYEPDYGYRYLDKTQTVEQDKVYVALVFSGGGTRAAALSYGVMKKLQDTAIDNDQRTLLDEVDLISSVSGGSFTAAYYGLFGDDLFSDFEPQFLHRNIQGELTKKLFNPVNWWRLFSPNFNRIDLAIELYDETVFAEKTYQDLLNNGRQPYIALNGTNLTTGSQFTFTQPAFDILGSDLSTVPVARAVATSSAFPVLLSPVTFRNYPASQGFALSKDIQLGLNDRYGGPNPRRYLWANNQAIYHNNKAEHPYVHLMDGGLSDNIGTRYVIDNFTRSSGFLFKRRTTMKELVVIMVNAKTEPPQSLDSDETPPNLLDVAYKTATVSLDNYSFESVQLVSELLGVSVRDAQVILQCQAVIDRECQSGYKLPTIPHSYQVTAVEINFLNIKESQQRQRMLSLPTSFSLSKSQVDELIEVASDLLAQDKAFNQLVTRLK